MGSPFLMAISMAISLAPLTLRQSAAGDPDPAAQDAPVPEAQAEDEADEDEATPGLEGADRLKHLLAEYAERAPIESRFVGLGELPAVEAALAELPAGELGPPRIDLLQQQGFHEMRLGRTEAAIQHYTEALALAERLSKPAKLAEDMRFQLALAWLRQGERDNCLARHTSQSCLLPIEGDGVHVDQEGSRKALEILLEFHGSRPDFASAAWLANLAAMTLGEWPDAIPEDWRVPPRPCAPSASSRASPTWPRSGGSPTATSPAAAWPRTSTATACSTWRPRPGIRAVASTCSAAAGRGATRKSRPTGDSSGCPAGST